MLKANWMVLLIIGTLLPAAGLADDATVSRGDGEPAPLATLPLESLRLQSVYAPRWQLPDPVETMDYADDSSRPMSDFDFQESGVLGRVSKLRGLSFLTFAEIGQTRLFLGVNKEGLVGLHFRAFPQHDNGRYLELIRMPYLENREPDTETD